MKRFFAGQSDSGSEASYGFANNWTVYVFKTKKARDKFVNESKNLSCIAIPFKTVTRYASNYSLTKSAYLAPRPFSGEYWGIDTYAAEHTAVDCYGFVRICDEYNGGERLYK